MSIFKPIRIAILVATIVAAATFNHVSSAADDVILRAATGTRHGTWSVTNDATAAGGSSMANPNAGAAKLTAPLANPANYFELTFNADAGEPYRLWLRGKAASNNYNNDSVYVQFSGSVTSGGTPQWRIGTTSATTVTIENCTSCGLSGWGWQDNGFGTGVLGAPVYFAATGPQTIRIQVREDGLAIDQVVLSPTTYYTSAPGASRNDQTILTGGGSPAISLVRGPYLQQVSDHSAVIVWASREPGPATASVGGETVAAVSRLVPASATGLSFNYYQHAASVTGLAPATTYGYDVFVGGAPATAGTDLLTTAPAAPDGVVRFIAIGDSGTGSAQQRALAALMTGDTFDLALLTGDIAYGNSGGTGDASYATFQSWFFDIYRDWLRRRPVFPSNGNHDARSTNDWGRAYLDLFVLPPDAGGGAYPDHAERYYSFDYGPVHFVALDTERAFQDTARRAEQLAWLQADLGATGQPWKIAYFHRSPYSAGGEHGSDLAVRQAFGPIFEANGVQLVLSAHEHVYERGVPWRVSSDPARQAVTHVVTGGGGGPVYPAGEDAWTARSASTHHYTKVTIDGCTASLHAISTSGTSIDSWSLNRCEQAADAQPPTVSFVSPAANAALSGIVTVEASVTDDVKVEKVDLWIDGDQRGIDLAAPYRFTWDTGGEAAGAHSLELRAYDVDGNRVTRTRAVTTSPSSGGGADVVIHAADVSPGSVSGRWVSGSDATAADGVRLRTANLGVKDDASATPVNYFETTFQAEAGVPYHLWLRLKADGNNWASDSVYVQFDGTTDGSGNPIHRIGTAGAATVTLEDATGAGVHGWGWNDNGFGGLGAHIRFAATGTQRIRVSMREDGASVDQIVISPGTYLTQSPGALKDDSTIVN
jgi:acid phosphatase type 7